MTSAAKSPYAGYRFPGEVISHAVWLYFRFPLSLRMVDEILAARGIIVSHEIVRRWARKFGQAFANQVRRNVPAEGDKWHLEEVAILSANSPNPPKLPSRSYGSPPPIRETGFSGALVS